MFRSLSEFDDKKALDWLAEILSEPEWEPDIIERIIEVVEWSGRTVKKEED